MHGCGALHWVWAAYQMPHPQREVTLYTCMKVTYRYKILFMVSVNKILWPIKESLGEEGTLEAGCQFHRQKLSWIKCPGPMSELCQQNYTTKTHTSSVPFNKGAYHILFDFHFHGCYCPVCWLQVIHTMNLLSAISMKKKRLDCSPKWCKLWCL